MTVRSALTDAVDKAVKPLGFRRRGTAWYRVVGDLYAVVGIQQSTWDESCYLNLGFTPADRTANSWLPETKCLVRFRVDALNSVSLDDMSLTQEEAAARLDEAELSAALTEKIVAPVVRILEAATDLRGLKEVLRSEVSDRVFIHREMRSLLEIHEP